MLAIRRGHLLPLRNGRVAPTTLSALPFVVTLTEKGPGLYGNVLALAREGGFSPNIAFHVQNLTTLLAVVSSGLAAAVVPTSLQMIHLRDVDYIPLDTIPLVERLALIRSRTNTSSVAEQFFKFCGAL